MILPRVPRRSFLSTAGGLLLEPLGAAPSGTFADSFFQPILEGFLRNAARTSDSLAVCDFPEGTILPGAVAKSGKTYDSVSRMLPAIAAWVASGRQPARDGVLLRIFQNAFDPAHPDYWRAAPSDRQHQLQVESSIVAWSLFLAADRILPRMTSQQRANAQDWLASCTRIPVRSNNWAWFTAVNQAARISLGRKWKEFSGDPAWMIEDLKTLDQMAAPGNDGWYSDSLREEVYDYYNFWVFASHFLYWNRIAGEQYPEWRGRFGARLKPFLERAPCFFGANGSHVLFGRSLIYRWAVLTPLVLAYCQGLWPHSPGLLRAIVRRNFEYLWSLGAFDARLGKLRESLSGGGTREIRESYVDNGHPYWGMQAFALYLIPPNDPFWTAAEEKLPVEKQSFRVTFEGPKMLAGGDRDTGEVRWVHSVNGHHEPEYRDKYSKFSYSSHFPWCILKDPAKCVWDAALVFRDPATGQMAGRSGMRGGRLTGDGVVREWSAQLGAAEIRVKTVIRCSGLFEYRWHEVEAPRGTEMLEGSFALGIADPARFPSGRGIYITGKLGGPAVALYGIEGYSRAFVDRQEGTNIIHPVVTIASLEAVAGQGATILECVHYASTRPLKAEEARRAAQSVAEKMRQAG